MSRESRRHIETLVLAVVTLSQLFSSRPVSGAQPNYTLHSPDQKIEVRVRTTDRVAYDVLLSGKMLLQDATIAIDIDHKILGLNPQVRSAKQNAVDREIEPVVRQKFAKLRENYRELRLEMAGDYSVTFRAYNEGVAYRLETSLPQREVKIYSEEVAFNFAGDYSVYYPKEDGFFSHNERHFIYVSLKEIARAAIASLPAVVDAKDGTKIALCESDVEDYPGLWLRGNSNHRLSGIFPPYPVKEELSEDRNRDRDFKVTAAADYIAMYIVYESPLQMLADSPSNYLREPEAMEFFGPVPTVWDETHVLDGKIGNYVAVARRRGNVWYIGAMTNWTARELEIDLSFLPGGNFQMEAYQDGVNADRYGSEFKKVSGQINRATKLKIKLAQGGGWVCAVKPQRG